MSEQHDLLTALRQELLDWRPEHWTPGKHPGLDAVLRARVLPLVKAATVGRVALSTVLHPLTDEERSQPIYKDIAKARDGLTTALRALTDEAVTP